MKLFRAYNLIIVTILLWSGSIAASPGELDKLKCSSINDLVGKGLLQANIMGSGGHEGECISMYLENPSTDTAFIWIEPGRVLSSLDTSTQDILITREELLALAPGEETTVDIYGFCSQALKASPDSAEMFRVGKMADSAVVILAEFLNEKNNNYPEDVIQEAIWCLTDDHSVANIYSEDLASIADLRTLVASLKGLEDEWYSVEEAPSNKTAYEFYTKTVTGKFELFIPTDCVVNIYVCDEGGVRYDEFEKNVPYKAGAYQYSFKLTAQNWPRGKYYLYITADGELLYRKEFEL